MMMADEVQSDVRLDKEQVRTYESFIGLLKWGVVVVAIILIGMAIFLGPQG